MKKSKTERVPTVVVDKNGMQGTVAQGQSLSSDLEGPLLVRFQNGQQVMVPREMLFRQDDGHYQLAVSIDELLVEQASRGSNEAFTYSTDEESLVIPVTEESVRVETRLRETGVVQIHKTVHERVETVDQPLQADEVQIERVTINRVVDGPVQIRNEGDTIIVPLLEEVLVIEKRLVLREEVHIKKLRREVHEPQEVLLREERVEIARQPISDQGYRQEETQQ